MLIRQLGTIGALLVLSSACAMTPSESLYTDQSVAEACQFAVPLAGIAGVSSVFLDNREDAIDKVEDAADRLDILWQEWRAQEGTVAAAIRQSTISDEELLALCGPLDPDQLAALYITAFEFGLFVAAEEDLLP